MLCENYWFLDEEIAVPSHILPVEPIGQGATSIVFSARDSSRSCMIAVKKLKNALRQTLSTHRALNEVLILRLLRHENIIGFHDSYKPQSSSPDLYLVTELIETDLSSVLKSAQDLSIFQCRIIFFQIMCALKYMHSIGIIHRDIKPRNVLLSSACDVKICDFGQAWCTQSEDPCLGNIVCTRWYRSPEIFREAAQHDEKVDIYSAGCVLAETFSRKPLLPGIDDEDQLELFFKRFGEIELEDGLGSLEENYSEIAKSISSSSQFLSRQENTGDLELYLGDSVPVIMRDLVRTLCSFNPKKRPSAAEVIKHTFFSDLDEPNHSIFTPC